MCGHTQKDSEIAQWGIPSYLAEVLSPAKINLWCFTGNWKKNPKNICPIVILERHSFLYLQEMGWSPEVCDLISVNCVNADLWVYEACWQAKPALIRQKGRNQEIIDLWISRPESGHLSALIWSGNSKEKLLLLAWDAQPVVSEWGTKKMLLWWKEALQRR